MLRSLHIENYILIDSLDIEFPEGLIIITGQTGAGKSILLGALSLLFGAKADASVVSQGAQSCVVEAWFDIGSAGHLSVRRVIYPSGRSRSFVNDCPVQVSALQRLSDRLVDIHSQHKTLLLTDRRFQLSLLDNFGGCASLLSECRSAYHEFTSARSALETLSDRKAKMEADREYNLAQFRQLEQANLNASELEDLEQEHRSLANAEQIASCLSGALSLLEDASGQGNSLAVSMKEAQRQLEHVSQYLPSAAELASRLESARLEVEDISSELDTMLSSSSASPDRLEQVEQRLSLLYSLMKRHSCDNIADLIRKRDSLASVLKESESVDDDIASLREKVSVSWQRYSDLASKLHALRCEAAPKLAAAVEDSLHFLELDASSFGILVESAEPGPCGSDSVRFVFSSTGGELQDLTKVASGGEMSRIMLCLKALMAKFVGMPTMIFDEIDTGVSGSVADKMGRMICSMGHDMQVFSITHLPQVAAKGDAHYVVSKESRDDGRTVSRIRKVTGEDRVHEIARLLSGSEITPAALANARALLDEGRAQVLSVDHSSDAHVDPSVPGESVEHKV